MTSTTASRAGTREWIALAALVLPALLASMDLSILFMASPWISADLEPTAAQQLWIMDIYGFVMAGLLISMGSIGDRIGRRRLLLIGALAFGAASVFAAVSTTPEMLIAARALLGFGGATLAPSTLSLIRSTFIDENQRRTAIGVWTAAFTGGVVIGPIIGGLMLEHWHWGSVFLINVPVMVLLLVLAPILLRESRDAHPGPFDLTSAFLSLAAVLPVIFGIKKLAEDGFGSLALIALVVGIAFGALFVRRQRRRAHPMIDVQLFARGGFGGAIGANTAITLASAGMGLLAVTFMQTVLGLTPFVAALWMLPLVIGSIVGVALATALAPRVPPSVLVSAGLVLGAAGFLLVSTLRVDSPVWMLIASYGLLTMGVGLTSTLATALVLSTAPPEKAGAASAIAETSTEFGGALGIAVLGSVAAGVYSASMHDELPAGTPAELAEAATETVGGAIAASEGLSPADTTAVLEAAFASFTQGFTTTAAIGAGILVIAAAASAVALRKEPVSRPAPSPTIHEGA